MTPWGGACMDPRCMVCRIYIRGEYIIMLHRILILWVLWFRRRFFFMFSHCKSRGIIGCHGNQSSSPKPIATIPQSFTLNLNSGKHIKLSILQKARKIVQLQLYSFHAENFIRWFAIIRNSLKTIFVAIAIRAVGLKR